MVAFTINDAITKSVSEGMNMGQVMFMRGLFATALVVLLAWQRGALRPLRTALQPTIMLRVGSEVLATFFFLIALSHLPIANVSAVLQALPLAVTVGAALVFSEPVGWRRWLAISVGFAGVLVIVRPGFEGFSGYSLLALACVAACAVRDLATKRIPGDVPTFFVSLVTSTVVTMAGGALVVPMGGWSSPSAEAVGLLVVAAVLLIIGYQFIIMSMRTGDISFIAPFRYTALLWSILLGFVVFHDVPDAAMIAGAMIVVGSGLYALYREQVVGRQKPVANSTGPAMVPDGM
jgi:drug/metabolite transporter (DMT)-like permease